MSIVRYGLEWFLLFSTNIFNMWKHLFSCTDQNWSKHYFFEPLRIDLEYFSINQWGSLKWIMSRDTRNVNKQDSREKFCFIFIFYCFCSIIFKVFLLYCFPLFFFENCTYQTDPLWMYAVIGTEFTEPSR